MVGKSGIATVDLYQTDNMRAWAKVANVDMLPSDAAPPQQPSDPNAPRLEYRKLSFEVQKEGVYGYIVGGKNNVGLGPGQPPENTKPRVIVEVDLTPPRVEVVEARDDPRDALELAHSLGDRRDALREPVLVRRVAVDDPALRADPCDMVVGAGQQHRPRRLARDQCIEVRQHEAGRGE